MHIVYKGPQLGGRAAVGVYFIRVGVKLCLIMSVSQCLESNMAAFGVAVLVAALLLSVS